MLGLADQAEYELKQLAKYSVEVAPVQQKSDFQKGLDELNKAFDKKAGPKSARLPLNEQKQEIVEMLTEINFQMRDFTETVESKLTQTLRQAGGRDIAKKYGIRS